MPYCSDFQNPFPNFLYLPFVRGVSNCVNHDIDEVTRTTAHLIKLAVAEVRLEMARRDRIEAFANAAARLDLCQRESREAPKACGGAVEHERDAVAVGKFRSEPKSERDAEPRFPMCHCQKENTDVA